MFVVLPTGQDVVDLQPKTTDKPKEHLTDSNRTMDRTKR